MVKKMERNGKTVRTALYYINNIFYIEYLYQHALQPFRGSFYIL